jgi:hypothetical protein
MQPLGSCVNFDSRPDKAPGCLPAGVNEPNLATGSARAPRGIWQRSQHPPAVMVLSTRGASHESPCLVLRVCPPVRSSTYFVSGNSGRILVKILKRLY